MSLTDPEDQYDNCPDFSFLFKPTAKTWQDWDARTDEEVKKDDKFFVVIAGLLAFLAAIAIVILFMNDPIASAAIITI